MLNITTVIDGRSDDTIVLKMRRTLRRVVLEQPVRSISKNGFLDDDRSSVGTDFSCLCVNQFIAYPRKGTGLIKRKCCLIYVS